MHAFSLIGAFEVLDNVEKAGLKADCMIYTTLISACAKAGNIESIFQACLLTS